MQSYTVVANITIQGETIEAVTTTKLLGVTLNNKLIWDVHVVE